MPLCPHKRLPDLHGISQFSHCTNACCEVYESLGVELPSSVGGYAVAVNF